MTDTEYMIDMWSKGYMLHNAYSALCSRNVYALLVKSTVAEEKILIYITQDSFCEAVSQMALTLGYPIGL